MTQTQPELEVPEVTPSAAPASRGLFKRYLGYLFLIPALVYFGTFLLVMVPAFGYERWGLSKWGPVLQFAFDAKQEDADVVIFGDSSAFLGVDPRIVDAKLGIRSVVLPNTIGSLPVTGDMALRRYLSQNKVPRVIVLYFSAWNLYYGRPGSTRLLFEGEEMLLRNGSWSQVLAFARLNPLEILAFPLRLHSTLGPHLVKMALRHPDREGETARALGHADYTEPVPQLTRPCALPDELLKREQEASVQALVRRYTTAKTRILVYLAPVPDCTNAERVANRRFARLGAQSPLVLPATWFSSDGFYAHIEPASVGSASDVFVRTIGPEIRRSVGDAGQPTGQ